MVESSEDKRLESKGSWCRLCGSGQTPCYVQGFAKDGTLHHVEGCSNAFNNAAFSSKSLCAKGNALPSLSNDAGRVFYPSRRVGKKGPGARFERISWDDALGQIAETIASHKASHGAESFGALVVSSNGMTQRFMRRLLNVHGSPNLIPATSGALRRDALLYSAFGGAGPTAPNVAAPCQIDKTDVLVLWGIDEEELGANRGDIRTWMRQQDRGMKIIDIRPVCGPLASKADKWVALRPGTDAALALGILHVICAEDLVDRPFVDTWCEGFDALEEALQPYSPGWAEGICGVPSKRIKEVARIIAHADPCGFVCGASLAEGNARASWELELVGLIGILCGNLGRPGGMADGASLPSLAAIGTLDTLANRLTASEVDKAKGWAAGAARVLSPDVPRSIFNEAFQPYATLAGALEATRSGDPYPLRSLVAIGANPLASGINPGSAAQALEALELFVCMDAHPSPACDYADIVLPLALPFEDPCGIDVRTVTFGSFLGIDQALCAAPVEAMGAERFLVRLACQLGYGDEFWGGHTEELLHDLLEPSGLSFDEVVDSADGLFVRRADRSACVLPTCPDYASLLAALPGEKVSCSALAQTLSGFALYGQTSQRGLVGNGEPQSDPKGYHAPCADYPLVFFNAAVESAGVHGELGHSVQLRACEPNPWVMLHPETAEQLEVADGQWVRVESAYGHCVLMASVVPGVVPGAAVGRGGWWQPCPELDAPGYSCFDGGAEPGVLFKAPCDQAAASLQRCVPVRIVPSTTAPEVYESSLETGGAGSLANAVVDQADLPEVEGPRTGRFSFLPALCIGCHACEVSCRQWHGIEDGGQGFRKVSQTWSGDVPDVSRVFLSERLPGCDMCAGTSRRPHCVDTCPTNAITWGFA